MREYPDRRVKGNPRGCSALAASRAAELVHPGMPDLRGSATVQHGAETRSPHRLVLTCASVMLDALELTLAVDHVAFGTRNLDRAQRRLSDLGLSYTAEAEAQWPGKDGEHPARTVSVMLDDGYLDIVHRSRQRPSVPNLTPGSTTSTATFNEQKSRPSMSADNMRFCVVAAPQRGRGHATAEVCAITGEMPASPRWRSKRLRAPESTAVSGSGGTAAVHPSPARSSSTPGS